MNNIKKFSLINNSQLTHVLGGSYRDYQFGYNIGRGIRSACNAIGNAVRHIHF